MPAALIRPALQQRRAELRSLISDGFGKVDLQRAYDRHNTLIAFSADAGSRRPMERGSRSPYTVYCSITSATTCQLQIC